MIVVVCALFHLTCAMAYNEKLANRIRERLSELQHIEEKKMMGGLTFMYNDKMCVGIIGDDLMCRINPELYEMAREQQGCRPMEFTGRALKGYVLVEESGMKSKKQFDYWIDLALAFNQKAKSSKRKSKK
jgi:TfoX/Sxy family transcriptional regulator of competence genes